MRARHLLRRLGREQSAIAMTEFALALPIVTTMLLSGAEIANFVTVKMRVSQMALHIADNAARMGSGAVGAAKNISEAQINDVLTGAGMQAAELNLYSNGRVILSQVEAVNPLDATQGSRIDWQRCRGTLVRTSGYGVENEIKINGIGPTGREVRASGSNLIQFAEVHYTYKPLFSSRLVPATTITEIASMMVRERRSQPASMPNPEGVTASTCDRYTST